MTRLAMLLVLVVCGCDDGEHKSTSSGVRGGEFAAEENRAGAYRRDYGPMLEAQMRRVGEDVTVTVQGTRILLASPVCGDPWLDRLPLVDMITAGFTEVGCIGNGNKIKMSLK